MKVKIYLKDGTEKSGVNFNSDNIVSVSDQTLVNYINYIRAGKRNTIANTLDRGQVSGGGKKPWRQKGTGHARVGSNRSPLWIHGGVTFGPTKDQNYSLKMNQKTRNAARKSIFLHFAKANRLRIIEKFEIDKFKTKEAESIIENLGLDGKISLFLGKSEIDSARAFRNLPYIVLNSKDNIDSLNLISSNWILMTEEAYKEMIGTSAVKKAQDESNN